MLNENQIKKELSQLWLRHTKHCDSVSESRKVLLIMQKEINRMADHYKKNTTGYIQFKEHLKS